MRRHCVLSFAVITNNYIMFLKSLDCVASLGPPKFMKKKKTAGLQGSFLFKDFLQTSVSALFIQPLCFFFFFFDFVLVCLPAIY